MCGIFGVINKNIDRQLAERCVNTLKHRGPDGMGLWQEADVTLGHRRLAILDLSENGRQPMMYRDRYVIAFNGEIYNFLEIRRELEKKGHSFRTETDTEVILAAFDEWREGCLSRFNGMWAFAIYDRSSGECFLARDRFGVKPLFYTALEGGGFAFASEMKAIIPLMDRPEINRDILTDSSLIMKYETGDECLIKGIGRVRAGEYALIRNGRITFSRWWDTLEHLIEAPERYEEQVELFRELFLDACRIRMRSDVTVGTALSGGLDSSSVISAMSETGKSSMGERINPNWQHAYVATFAGTSFDEAVYARMVTDHLGIDGTFLNIDPVKYWDNIGDAFYYFEENYHTSPIPMMAVYDAERKDGTVVTIDGHGADELFCGYSTDVRRAFNDSLPDLKKTNMVIDTYLSSNKKTGSLDDGMNRFKTIFNFCGHRVKQLLLREREYKRLYGLHEPCKAWDGMDYLNRVLYDDTHCSILPTLLRNYDRYSMANSVEIRMPFLDHRIVELAFSIGWNSKIRNGCTKAIVRDAMAPYLPEQVAYRKDKIGFNTPILEWISGDLKEWFLDTVHSQDFLESDLVDGRAVCEKTERIAAGGDAVKYSTHGDIWKQLSPYLWKKYFYDRAVNNG